MERYNIGVPYTPQESVLYNLAFLYSIKLFLFVLILIHLLKQKNPNNLAIAIDKLISSHLPDGTMF